MRIRIERPIERHIVVAQILKPWRIKTGGAWPGTANQWREAFDLSDTIQSATVDAIFSPQWHKLTGWQGFLASLANEWMEVQAKVLREHLGISKHDAKKIWRMADAGLDVKKSRHGWYWVRVSFWWAATIAQ